MTTTKTHMHYSVPGVQRHEGQTVDLADAQEKARRTAEQTRSPAAILSHWAPSRGQVGPLSREGGRPRRATTKTQGSVRLS